jgi:hypothetical protein
MELSLYHDDAFFRINLYFQLFNLIQSLYLIFCFFAFLIELTPFFGSLLSLYLSIYLSSSFIV